MANDPERLESRGRRTVSFPRRRLRSLSRSPHTSADQGLGASLLDNFTILIQNPAAPGYHSAPASGARFERFDTRDDVNGVAEHDREVERPLEDPEECQGVDPGCMTGQTGYDRQAEQSVRNRLAEGMAPGGLVVHVERVEVAGKAGEGNDIGLGHSPVWAFPFVANG